MGITSTQRNTSQRHLAISNNADIAFFQDEKPGFFWAKAAAAGGWLEVELEDGWRMACMNRKKGTRKPPKKNTKIAFLDVCCVFLPRKKTKSSQTHRNADGKKKTYQWFSYHNHYLYTLHKQSSRTHAPKSYRCKECGFASKGSLSA